MLGHPKYKVGESVEIHLRDEIIEATIAIVDAYGTFDYTKDVSYDCWIVKDGQRALFKHIPEKYIMAAET